MPKQIDAKRSTRCCFQYYLADRGTEYCGNRESHEYQLYLAVEDIDHSKTKARSSQTNGICERFHKTIRDEFYSIAFRKKIYRSLEEIQEDADKWIEEYNKERTHSGRYCFGKTPWQPIWTRNIWQKKRCWISYNQQKTLMSERSQLSDDVLATTN